MDFASLLTPWADLLREQLPGLELFDAHTHLGRNDPDGMSQTPEQLLGALRESGARGAFVFPMHEPEGYPAANDMVLDVARNAGGRLTAFCRVDPRAGDAPAEATRALDAGARGIKLHPRAEQFTLDHPAVAQLAALADERGLPILIHAGRGIPALGRHAVQLAGAFPRARFILAHAAVCDLAWLWRVADDHPNLLFDTSWWMPADLQTLFSLVAPGQILFASDAPYGHPLASAIFQLRNALQVGLSPAQIRCIAAEQSLRIAAGEPLEAVGPAIGERERASHLLLDRVAEYLMLGALATLRGSDGGPEMLALARLACDVPEEIDDAPVFAAVRRLLDAFDQAAAREPDNRRWMGLLILAANVARTPDVPVPDAVIVA
jgi:predicted TIM-barrel fold metal-dependent hydrolase